MARIYHLNVHPRIRLLCAIAMLCAQPSPWCPAPFCPYLGAPLKQDTRALRYTWPSPSILKSVCWEPRFRTHTPFTREVTNTDQSLDIHRTTDASITHFTHFTQGKYDTWLLLLEKKNKTTKPTTVLSTQRTKGQKSFLSHDTCAKVCVETFPSAI